eukprot:76217-Amphidinium_carterae.1
MESASLHLGGNRCRTGVQSAWPRDCEGRERGILSVIASSSRSGAITMTADVIDHPEDVEHICSQS